MLQTSTDLFNVIQYIHDLDPTDVELTYMLAQLCFQYAGNRHRGEIQEVCEQFQNVLSNDLHDYYLNEMRMPRYSRRIAKMMQINNYVQVNINNMLTKCFYLREIFERVGNGWKWFIAWGFSSWSFRTRKCFKILYLISYFEFTNEGFLRSNVTTRHHGYCSWSCWQHTHPDRQFKFCKSSHTKLAIRFVSP